jgi:hypothetical protein
VVGAEGVEESAAEPYLCGNAPVISMNLKPAVTMARNSRCSLS